MDKVEKVLDLIYDHYDYLLLDELDAVEVFLDYHGIREELPSAVYGVDWDDLGDIAYPIAERAARAYIGPFDNELDFVDQWFFENLPASFRKFIDWEGLLKEVKKQNEFIAGTSTLNGKFYVFEVD